MHFLRGFIQPLFNDICLWTGKAQTRLRICKYILLHLNHGFDASRVCFKPSTLFHTILHVSE